MNNSAQRIYVYGYNYAALPVFHYRCMRNILMLHIWVKILGQIENTTIVKKIDAALTAAV